MPCSRVASSKSTNGPGAPMERQRFSGQYPSALLGEPEFRGAASWRRRPRARCSSGRSPAPTAGSRSSRSAWRYRFYREVLAAETVAAMVGHGPVLGLFHIAGVTMWATHPSGHRIASNHFSASRSFGNIWNISGRLIPVRKLLLGDLAFSNAPLGVGVKIS